jgi:hypothetical protein
MMTSLQRYALSLVLAAMLAVAASGSTSAQELPTGAARVVEKVQTRIFIAKANLQFHVAAILENQPAPSGK